MSRTTLSTVRASFCMHTEVSERLVPAKSCVGPQVPDSRKSAVRRTASPHYPLSSDLHHGTKNSLLRADKARMPCHCLQLVN